MSVATILIQVSRLARVVNRFQKGDPGLIENLPSFRPPAQLAFILSLTAVGSVLQVLLLFVAFEPTSVKRIYTDTAFYEVCEVHVKADAIIDSYLVTLLLISTALAFQTRKLPKHRKSIFFREARPLFYVTFCLTAIWLIILTIRSISREENEAIIAIIRSLGHVCIIWAWLFLPKLYGVAKHWDTRNRSSSSLVNILDISPRSSGVVLGNPMAVRMPGESGEMLSNPADSLRTRRAFRSPGGADAAEKRVRFAASFKNFSIAHDKETQETPSVESPLATEFTRFLGSTSSDVDCDDGTGASKTRSERLVRISYL